MYNVNGVYSTLNARSGGDLEPKILLCEKEMNEDVKNKNVSKRASGMIFKEMSDGGLRGFRTNDKRYAGEWNVIGENTVYSPTVTISNCPKVKEPSLIYQKQPNGNVRAYRADDKLRKGRSDIKIITDESESSYTNTAAAPLKYLHGGYIRKLTPRECFRLMGVSETDIDKIQSANISDAQQYKMAGNSIVVDVLAEIFKKLFINTEPDNGQQLKLF